MVRVFKQRGTRLPIGFSATHYLFFWIWW